MISNASNYKPQEINESEVSLKEESLNEEIKVSKLNSYNSGYSFKVKKKSNFFCCF